MLYVHLGGVAPGDAFFDWADPQARAIADPTARLYEAFGLPRGGIKELFGPAVWACGVRATRKGHAVGRPVGDPFRMPGFFLVERGEIVWRHEPKHAGDHPDFGKVPEHAGRS